uniref:Uncharacterized protein n=1 Tax=Glossina brevipalpis TaxID=37001 RepID=A0A1A9WRM0_9MUSC
MGNSKSFVLDGSDLPDSALAADLQTEKYSHMHTCCLRTIRQQKHKLMDGERQKSIGSIESFWFYNNIVTLLVPISSLHLTIRRSVFAYDSFEKPKSYVLSSYSAQTSAVAFNVIIIINPFISSCCRIT